jgi:superfamily II DNA helicase RecQ
MTPARHTTALITCCWMLCTQRCYGYSELYGWQREVIEALLAGNDAIVARPTGGGKSLCFQLPALIDALSPRVELDYQPYKTAVVVVPSVSLMVDQVNQLNSRLSQVMGNDLSTLGVACGGKAAALLGSAQTDPTVAPQAMAGAYRVLYITERLLFGTSSPWVDNLQELHRTGRLLLLAVDEAHVVPSAQSQPWRPPCCMLPMVPARRALCVTLPVPHIAGTRVATERLSPRIFATGRAPCGITWYTYGRPQRNADALNVGGDSTDAQDLHGCSCFAGFHLPPESRADGEGQSGVREAGWCDSGRAAAAGG